MGEWGNEGECGGNEEASLQAQGVLGAAGGVFRDLAGPKLIFSSS